MDDLTEKRFKQALGRVASAKGTLFRAVPELVNECNIASQEFTSLVTDLRKKRVEELRLRYEREDTSRFEDKEWKEEYDELFRVLTEDLSSFFHFLRSTPEDTVVLPAGRELVAVVILRALSSLSKGSIH